MSPRSHHLHPPSILPSLLLTMSPPTITGIHLVGSIPLPTTKEVFTTITRALPNGLLTRIPDGEVGERCNFITWQGRILAKKDFLLRETFRKGLKLDPVHLELSAEEVEDGKKELEAWEMETEWDRFALASWEVSKESKEEGVVGEEVRFLVCLPSAVTMTSLCVREEFQEIFERVYERALVGVVERLGSVIPRGEFGDPVGCSHGDGDLGGERCLEEREGCAMVR